MKLKQLFISLFIAVAALAASAQNNVAEEVAWVVGDQPIYKSDIEKAYQQMLYEHTSIKGNPYCVIPERLAIEKLYLNQADIDTIEAQNSMVAQQVESHLQNLIAQYGSKEKLEEYSHQTIPSLREMLTENYRNYMRIGQVKQSLVKGLKVTPNDVRRYFSKLPEDSIPMMPLQVEVQIITINPVIPRQEIDDVKARLRDFSERVNSGDADFSTLASLYSEDLASSVRGGELGFYGRSALDPEYAAVAFNLSDPKKVSKIVESEYGYHIIQLIEKRGDRVNTRHILLRPKVSDEDLISATHKLDSAVAEMRDKKYTFEEAAPFISQDKDTRNSRGMMVNPENGNTRMQMQELPLEVGRVVEKMQPGDISDAFVMMDTKRNREVVAIVKLANRIPAHKANLSDDYQVIKNMYEAAERARIEKEWLEKKIKNTYVKIEDGWNDCEFEHKGWIR